MDSQSSQGDSQFADSRKWDISWCGRQRTTFHVMMGFSRRLRQDAAKNRGLWIQDFQMVDSVDRQYLTQARAGAVNADMLDCRRR
jgi:hypothetical protein